MPKKTPQPLSREDARARYVRAVRDLALSLPASDARAIADVHTRRSLATHARVASIFLLRDGIATTIAVAREAAKIINARRSAAGAKALVRQDWDAKMHRHYGPRHVAPVWERERSERLRSMHESLAHEAWERAAFRKPSTRWVSGSGERLAVVLTAQEGAERIEVGQRKVWARNGKYSATRLDRDLILSREWVTNVLRRGIANIFGDGTFVLRARPFPRDPNSVECVVAVQGVGFKVNYEGICIRRGADGEWFAGLRRVDGRWTRTGREVM